MEAVEVVGRGIVPGGHGLAKSIVPPVHPPSTSLSTLQEYDGDQLRQLVHSLCPSIFGHDLVKAGLLLALFGGVRKEGGPNRVPTRGDVHVLVVGDPGLGKSQLLQVGQEELAGPRI